MDLDDWTSMRWLNHREGKSQRWISKEFGISRNTIAKYLQNPDPPKYTMKVEREQPLRKKWRPIVAAILEADKTAPKKQRHTARRVFDRLVSEHGYTGSVRTIQYLITEFKQKRTGKDISIPLAFEAGKDAQVDFSESVAKIAGVKQKVFGFEMRLNFSRKKFVMFFPCQNREAFLEGHVQAFKYFGGVPARISYDNTKVAVKKILSGKQREITDSFKHLKGHYTFQDNFCTPGKGNEKGGVESSIGYSRRNWMVPVPEFDSLEALNKYILEKCDHEDHRQVAGTDVTIGEAFEVEKLHLLQLPAKSFECALLQSAMVDAYSTVVIARNHYSVPMECSNQRLLVKAFWDRVEITDGKKIIAVHQRCHSVGKYIFDPYHYIDSLEKKPNSIPYAAPILQQDWPSEYWIFFERLKKVHDSSKAGKEFVRLLRMHKQFGASVTLASIRSANEMCATNCDVVLSIIHLKLRAQNAPETLELVNAGLIDHAVQLPDALQYNKLLKGVAHG